MTQSKTRFEFSPLSVAQMLWNGRLTLFLVFLGLAGAGNWYVRRLPNLYRAKAVVLVDAQRIPVHFVATTVGGDALERLAGLSREVMVPDRLRSVSVECTLYPALVGQKTSAADMAVIMRRDISVRPERGANDRVSLLHIFFQSPNRNAAACAANELAKLFIQVNGQEREAQTKNTANFLETEVERAKERLQQQESLLGRYKLAHPGELPQQESSNSSLLLAQLAELRSNEILLSRSQQEKAGLQSSLAAAKAIPPGATGANRKASTPSEVQVSARTRSAAELLQAELDNLLLRYGDQHPEVRRVREILARTRQAESQSNPEVSVKPAKPLQAAREEDLNKESDPVLERERLRAASLETEIQLRSREVEGLESARNRLEQEISATRSRIAAVPLREQEITSISREYEVSRAAYQSLLDKRLAAQVAADMESSKQAETFSISEPAVPPEVPFKPQRGLLYAIATMGSLVLSFMVVLGLEYRQDRVLGDWEIPAEVPVLGRIPLISSPPKQPVPVSPGLKLSWRLEGERHASPEKGAQSRVPQPQLAPGLDAFINLESGDLRAMEQYRMVRIRTQRNLPRHQILMITSPSSGDGKTTTTMNLGILTAAANTRRTLIIEADFYRPRMARMLGRENALGLADVLRGTHTLLDTVMAVSEHPNLFILPAGNAGRNGPELLQAALWASLLGQARSEFQAIYLDAPPTGPVADCELLQNLCDGIVLVVRPDNTDRKFFREALVSLQRNKVAGVVWNCSPDRLFSSKSSYYHDLASEEIQPLARRDGSITQVSLKKTAGQ